MIKTKLSVVYSDVVFNGEKLNYLARIADTMKTRKMLMQVYL